MPTRVNISLFVKTSVKICNAFGGPFIELKNLWGILKNNFLLAF